MTLPADQKQNSNHYEYRETKRVPYYTTARRDARLAIEAKREQKRLVESFGELTLSTKIV